MASESDKRADVTWLNAKDSLKHALDHFFELANSEASTWHHQKWIILSVHHAASCLASLWLKAADANNALFVGRNDKEAYPHLDELIKELQKYKGTKHLTVAESELLGLLKRLNDIRNKFMHRLPPKEIDREVVSCAAMSMVGLLHVVERRSGVSFYDQFDQFPEIRKYVMEVIHYSKINDYFAFIEKVLKDQFPSRDLPQCPSCGARAIIAHHCEACFEDVSEVECPQCQSEFYIQDSYPFEQECPECGYGHKA